MARMDWERAGGGMSTSMHAALVLATTVALLISACGPAAIDEEAVATSVAATVGAQGTATELA
jgi:hypothetical protein